MPLVAVYCRGYGIEYVAMCFSAAEIGVEQQQQAAAAAAVAAFWADRPVGDVGGRGGSVHMRGVRA